MQRRRILKTLSLGLTFASLAGASLAGAALGESLPPPDEAAGLARVLARAEARGDNAALIAFIARNPDEPLAERARAALRARPLPDPTPADGPDGAIFLAFDRARLSADPAAALADFARTYSGHPLAAEAARPIWVGR